MTTVSKPSDRASRGGRYAAFRRVAEWLFRGVLLVLLLQLALGLAASLQHGSSPRDLSAALVHGDLGQLVFSWHSPLRGLRGIGASMPLTAFILFGATSAAMAVLLTMRLGPLVGLALAVILLVATLRTTGAQLWGDLKHASKSLLALALLGFGGVLFVGVLRWGLLLQVQGVHLTLRALSRLTLIGVFFNLAIPGAVGGDLVKMGYIAREAPDRKAEAMLTILLDRVVGILGLFIVAAVAVIAALPVILELEAKYRAVKAGAILVALGSIGGICGILLVEFRSKLVQYAWIAKMVDIGNRILPEALTEILRRLVEAVELYRDHRMVVVKATLLAIVVHSLLALNLFCIGKALGEKRLGLHHYIVAASVSNTVASIPVTPGGVGTRDATAAAFFAAFEARPKSTVGSIPVTMSLVIVAWGLIGAGVFIGSGRNATADGPDRDD